MPKEIRIAIVEDVGGIREGLARLIGQTPGMQMSGSFESMEDALAAMADDAPDVLLADIGLPGLSGIAGVRRLKEMHPALAILMLTVYDDNEHVFEAICAGASGYLLKDTAPDRLREAIRELAGGGAPMTPVIAAKVIAMFQRTATGHQPATGLTPREVDVLRLLADGHSYKTAADTLGVSMDTFRFHIRNAYEKLHVHSKSQAVSRAFKSGILR
jgi:DNA-binding NarL/FixJ family response regulator